MTNMSRVAVGFPPCHGPFSRCSPFLTLFPFLVFPDSSIWPSSHQSRGFHSSSFLGKPRAFFVYLMAVLAFLLLVLLFPSPSMVREFGFHNSVFSMDSVNFWMDGDSPEQSSQTVDSELQNNVSALPAFRCTASETSKQAESFEKNKNSWSNFQLGCAEPVRLESFLAQIWPLSRRPVTLVNIGANKGE